MCSDENVMMLSETKNILSEFIRHNDAPFIYEKVGNRYDRFMIDEYQDSNAVQERIFQAVSRDGKNLFMVGDVKQSIYRFRLADPTIFLSKYDAYPPLGTQAPG